MAEMKDVEVLSKDFADAHRNLEAKATRLVALQEAINRRLVPGLKAAVEHVNEAKQKLHNMIDGNRRLFDEPRTHVFHGIKVGLKKGTGSIEFESEEKVIELIKEKLPALANDLIETSESLLKKSLADLSADELKKIGVTVEGTGDHVVINPTASHVDKLVKALLKEPKAKKEPARRKAA